MVEVILQCQKYIGQITIIGHNFRTSRDILDIWHACASDKAAHFERWHLGQGYPLMSNV